MRRLTASENSPVGSVNSWFWCAALPVERDVLEARPADLPVQRPGDRQRGVADGLPLEPPPVGPPEQAIVGVEALGALVADPRLLPVRRGGDDQAVQVLDLPSPFHEPRREVVEQLRMARPAAVEAEVARRLDQPLAEVVIPEPVHEDAGRQRVARGRSASAPGPRAVGPRARPGPGRSRPTARRAPSGPPGRRPRRACGNRRAPGRRRRRLLGITRAPPRERLAGRPAATARSSPAPSAPGSPRRAGPRPGSTPSARSGRTCGRGSGRS